MKRSIYFSPFLLPFIILLVTGIALYMLLFHTDSVTPHSDPPPAVPLGLPPVPWPKENPYSKAKAELGKKLYFDERLSTDNSVSCATCHNAPCGYSDCHKVAIGINRRQGMRHSPTIINCAYVTTLFWDGRASSLEEQCQGPIANPKEMTLLADPHEAHKDCVEKVRGVPEYRPLFQKAFGSSTITLDKITKAIATFERTVLSGNSPFDRFAAGDRSALTREQIQGLKLFKKTGCVNCHEGFNLTDNAFHNIGVGMDAEHPDLGRYMITKKATDWGAFKTPGLREVAQTAPYMHDGSLGTLEEVIDYYDRGGNKSKNLHPLMKPLHLTPEEKKALISFLNSLSGEGWQHIQE